MKKVAEEIKFRNSIIDLTSDEEPRRNSETNLTSEPVDEPIITSKSIANLILNEELRNSAPDLRSSGENPVIRPKE